MKIGSSVLSNPDGGLNPASLERLAFQLIQLHQKGHEVILVSSGAIASGVGRLGWKEKPSELRSKQAAAAIGQLALMKAYEDVFSKAGILPAQVLLTREDLINRQRYLNIRNTLLRLLELKAIPIINENDCVSTEEIQFGDNDTLSAIVATKVEADKLVILSDVAGLYRVDEKGALTKDVVPVVEKITPELEKSVSKTKSSKLTVGGMAAKLSAAKMATAAGVEVWIASGHEADSLEKILSGALNAGTRFPPRVKKIESRDAWIAFGRKAKGFLTIDEGAVRAIAQEGKSLLPSGITKVKGAFAVGDMVGVEASDGVEIARGLVNFSSADVQKIRGRHSNEIPSLLGRSTSQEVIHRDNLVLL